MDRPCVETVLLPNGNKVSVSNIPEEWWESSDGAGYVSPDMLAPDPKQPRRTMDPVRLAELQKSVATSGVCETIVVTPLKFAPWAKVEAKYKDRFFLIVSGHRRWTSAELASLKAVPIDVRIYRSAKEHHLERSLLNKNHDGLTELDVGYEIVELKKDGWKVHELSEKFGMAVPQLYNRINLTRLHPDIQELLQPHEGRHRKTMLPITTAGALGNVSSPKPEELEKVYDDLGHTKDIYGESLRGRDFTYLDEDERRFELQKLLLSVIQARSLGTTRAVEFIRDRVLRLSAAHAAGGRKTERYQPRRRKEVLRNLIGDVTGSVVMDWPPAELRRVFELASREEVDAFVTSLHEAAAFLNGLEQILSSIRDGKKEMSAEVRELIESAHGKPKTGASCRNSAG